MQYQIDDGFNLHIILRNLPNGKYDLIQSSYNQYGITALNDLLFKPLENIVSGKLLGRIQQDKAVIIFKNNEIHIFESHVIDATSPTDINI